MGKGHERLVGGEILDKEGAHVLGKSILAEGLASAKALGQEHTCVLEEQQEGR